MPPTLLYFGAIFIAIACASPLHRQLDIVEVRQVSKRQDLSSIDLSDLSTLFPSLSIPPLESLDTALPSISIPSFSMPSFSSIDLNTLIPSGCTADVPDPPTPPPEVGSILESAYSTYTDPCNQKVPKITGSAGKIYSSYESALSSWGKANSKEIEKWQSEFSTKCPWATERPKVTGSGSLTLGTMSMSFQTDLTKALSEYCSASKKSAASAGSTGGGGGGATGTGSDGEGTGTATGAQAAGATSTGAAAAHGPHKNGIVVAGAGILAGFVGVVAAL